MTDTAGFAPLAVTLSNPRADRVKRVRALAGVSVRKREGLFLVEGPEAVREAVRFWPASVRDVYLTPDAVGRHPGILADAARLHVHGATLEVVEAMSRDAQGALGVLETRNWSIDNLPPSPKLVAVLSNVRNPGNAGAAIRAADAAGADAVIFAGDSVEVFNPKVVRATTGSLFHLPIITGVTLADAVLALRERGMRVFAADSSGPDALHLGCAGEASLTDPTAWVFGNEAWGLTESDLALADRVVHLPMYGKAESLNLAQAVAVFLFATVAEQRNDTR